MKLIAERLDEVAASLTTVERRLGAEAGPEMFASAEAGTPGRAAQRLQEHWAAVVGARSQEAADVARQVARLADDVRTTDRDYADTDHAVAARLRRDS